MKMNLITLAIPVFLLLMGVEYLLSYRRKEHFYFLNDFSNNISCGVLEQVACLPFQGLLIYSYHYLYQNFSLFNVDPHAIYSWILLWLGADFLYYWFHRASHRNTFLWIGHSVHHQSEQYNLSVALRQGILQTLCSWVIYLPLACLGFPVWMFLIISSLITLYQFWIHTKLISHLGWFEMIFNTPSHHRVHHGKNACYIDKNYGGSLIIWDKLFGTYEKETEPVEYGTTEPLNSWNPFHANVKTMLDVFYYGHYLNRFLDKILAFIRPPEWIVNQLGVEKMQEVKRKRVIRVIQSSAFYVLFNIALVILGYSYCLVTFDFQSGPPWLVGLFTLITIYQVGRVLNGGIGARIKAIELVRFGILFLVFNWVFQSYLRSFSLVSLLFLVNTYSQKETNSQADCEMQKV